MSWAPLTVALGGAAFANAATSGSSSSSAPYEAHIRKADGTEVEVQVSSDFTVAAVNQMDGPGRHR